MSTETIPLSFEAVDNLTKAVTQMTALLEKMGAAQEETTEATEEATKATEAQGVASSRTGDLLVKLNAGVELAKSAYESLGGAIEIVGAALETANEKWDEQSRKQGKAASALGSIAEANTKLEKAQDRTWASLGKIIDRSSVYQSVALAKADALKALGSWLDANSEQIARWGNNIAVWGSGKLEELGRWVTANAESLARFQVYLEGVGQLVVTTGHGVDALAQALKIGLYGAASGAATMLATLTEGLIELLRLAGQEVPQALEDLRLGLKEVERAAGDEAVSSFNRLNAAVDNTAASGSKAFDALAKASTGSRSEIAEQIKGWEAAGRAAEGYGVKLQKNLQRGMSGGGRRRGDLVDAETAAEEKRAALLLDYDRRILEATKAQNQEQVLLLTREKALVEARQSLKDIKTQELRTATMTVAELQAQLDYEQGLKDLAAQRRADRQALAAIEDQAWRERLERDEAEAARIKERGEQALAQVAARREAEIERAQAIAEAVAEGFGGLGDLLGEVDEQTSRIVGSLERGVGSAAKFGAALRTLVVNNKSLKDSANEVNAALAAGTEVASALVAGLVDNAKTRAKIEAAINAAAAIAATAFGLATGNPSFFAAAAGHASAAVKYGLMASGAFDGGGGGAVAGGAGAGAGAAPSAPLQNLDLERERSLNAEAIAEAMRDEGRGGSVNIAVNLSGALIAGESPQAARTIVDLIAPELALIVG